MLHTRNISLEEIKKAPKRFKDNAFRFKRVRHQKNYSTSSFEWDSDDDEDSPFSIVPHLRNRSSSFGQFKPSDLGEVHDDILIYIFSFLQSRELIQAGRVVKSWRRSSSSDYLWKRLLIRTSFPFVDKQKVTKNHKKEFVRCMLESRQHHEIIQKTRRKLETVNSWSWWFRLLYSKISPPCILFGCFVALLGLAFLIAFDLSGISQYMFWYISGIPLAVLVVPNLLFLIIGLCVDTTFFTRCRKSFNHVLKTNKTDFDDPFFVNLTQLLVSGVAFYPICVICSYLHHISHGHVNVVYCFIPMYLWCVFYAIFPMLKLFRLTENFENNNDEETICCEYQCEEEEIILGMFWIPLFVINVLITIQVLVISLRADGIISTPGSNSFVPLLVNFLIYSPTIMIVLFVFLICPICCCFCMPMCYICGVRDEDCYYFSCCTGTLGLICSMFCAIPIVVFITVLVLQLSAIIPAGGYLVLTFLPCLFVVFPFCCYSLLTCFFAPKDYFIC